MASALDGENTCSAAACQGSQRQANIAAIGILRKNGETVRTRDFLRIGVPFTLAAVLVGAGSLWLFWGI
jgi:Na+/H+ antiporter NhaD/arsenite permease-like protein